MFGPLTLCFIISYVVHLVHVRNVQTDIIHIQSNHIALSTISHMPTVCWFQVMKLVRMRQQGLDDDFEGKTYSRVSNLDVHWISYFIGRRQAQCSAWEGWNGRTQPFSMWGLRMSLRITSIRGQTIRFSICAKFLCVKMTSQRDL